MKQEKLQAANNFNMTNSLSDFKDTTTPETQPLSIKANRSSEEATIESGTGINSASMPTEFVQYSKMGPGYVPTSGTTPILKAGVYSVNRIDSGLPIFIPSPIKSDNWLNFKNDVISNILNEINTFWLKKAEFAKYGFLQRRGYMLYGPAGTGKTILTKQIMSKIIEDDGIVLLCQSPYYLINGIDYLRRVEPNRRLVVVMEDIDSIIDQYGESSLLSYLDGEHSGNYILNIATTNYPEKLDKRIVARPRRFDRLIKIGYPEKDERRHFFKEKLQLEDSELDEWVNVTDHYTFAAMSELVISVKCLGNDLQKAAKDIQSLLESKPSSNDYENNRKMGFAAGFGIGATSGG